MRLHRGDVSQVCQHCQSVGHKGPAGEDDRHSIHCAVAGTVQLRLSCFFQGTNTLCCQLEWFADKLDQDAICHFAPQFRGTDQHDSQEFLAFLLDGLHEDLNMVQVKPKPIEFTPEREAELETLSTKVASAKEWDIYLMRDNSIIVQWFQGQYRSRLQCLTCGKVCLLSSVLH